MSAQDGKLVQVVIQLDPDVHRLLKSITEQGGFKDESEVVETALIHLHTSALRFAKLISGKETESLSVDHVMPKARQH